MKDERFLQDPHSVAKQILEASDDSGSNADNGAIARCIILGKFLLIDINICVWSIFVGSV